MRPIFLALLSLALLSPCAMAADWQTLNAKVADLYQQAKYKEAMGVAEEALAAAQKTYGKSSPETALSLNNLAMLSKVHKDFVRAEKLYLQSLEISEKIVGPEHPDLTIPLSNLAMLYAEEKEFGKAFELSDRAVSILENKYGPDHRNVGIALQKYAGLKRMAGKTKAAEELEARAASIAKASGA